MTSKYKKAIFFLIWSATHLEKAEPHNQKMEPGNGKFRNAFHLEVRITTDSRFQDTKSC